MQMGTFMKETGLKIKLMDMGSTNILTARSMRVIGKKISSMDLEEKSGQMELNSRETTLKGRNRGKGSLLGPMGALTRVTFMKITSTEEEYIVGLMEGCTMEHGSVIKCMVMGRLPGQMGEDMKASMWTTRRKGKECSNGQMDGNMWEDGTMVSSTDKASTFPRMGTRERENGIWAKGSNG